MHSKWSTAYWQDLGERVGATAIATFIPLYAATSNVAGLDWVTDVELAGSAAGLTLLKGLLVNLRGAQASASLAGVSSTKKRG